MQMYAAAHPRGLIVEQTSCRSRCDVFKLGEREKYTEVLALVNPSRRSSLVRQFPPSVVSSVVDRAAGTLAFERVLLLSLFNWPRYRLFSAYPQTTQIQTMECADAGSRPLRTSIPLFSTLWTYHLPLRTESHSKGYELYLQM